jgi:hypothetical protein
MFIQVIEGHTGDPEALRRQLQRWEQDLQPDAPGFLGATGGVAADGTAVVMARFDSIEDARRNNARREQDAWWRETEKCFDGEVVFRDCTEVDTMLGGGSDQAGFVQFMQGHARNKARLRELEEQMLPQMTRERPDVMGSVRAWDGDHFTDAIYFTSEAEAREREAEMPDEGGPEMAEMGSLITDISYVDLTQPWLRSG